MPRDFKESPYFFGRWRPDFPVTAWNRLTPHRSDRLTEAQMLKLNLPTTAAHAGCSSKYGPAVGLALVESNVGQPTTKASGALVSDPHDVSPVNRLPMPRRMRRRHAAKYLGVSVGFLEKCACRGTGPPYLRLSARLVVYEVDALDAWAAARRVRNTSEAARSEIDATA
jgi:hypothetical protein